MPKQNATVDPEEIKHFQSLANTWWDEQGPFRALHKINPVRLAFIKTQIEAIFGQVKGLKILDIGCGGGLLCEPLARLGAQVTGIDATPENIDVAKAHAQEMGLDIDYRAVTSHDLLEEGGKKAAAKYDVVISMEVLEHVADPGAFLESCCDLMAPGGLMLLSTLNRTHKSYLMGIVAAEYILNWVPKGTHQWKKFLKPSEIAKFLRPKGVRPTELKGMGYDVFTDDWSLTDDLKVNYLMAARAVV